MRLKEFIDKNGNKVNLKSRSSGSANKTSTDSKGFKSRLYKLVKYHEHHPGPDIEYLSIDSLTEDSIKFTEYYKSGAKVYYEIYIGATTEAWSLKVTSDNGFISNDSGMGWASLLKHLRFYITIPVVGTQEYKNILTEWVDAKGNKVNLKKTSSNSSAPATKSNKEKFEELIKYMEKYEVPYTTKMETIQLDNTCFKYNISVKSPGIKEYVVTLEVDYSRFNSSWSFVVYRNGDYVDDSDGKGWEELLKALSTSEFGNYANIPKSGSKEYESLTESTSIAEEFKTYENLWD